ncbi:MAG: hypothetical protein FWH29_11065 [Methanobrevibacter sp.]|nr:hypothetical protein [Methanobrevibacter sp.]
MIENKRTTINIPKDMLKAVKSLAVEKETTQTNIILDFIAKGLKATEKDNPRIKQMPFVDPENKKDFKDSIGIIEVENPENLDVLELKDSIHFKKELY